MQASEKELIRSSARMSCLYFALILRTPAALKPCFIIASPLSYFAPVKYLNRMQSSGLCPSRILLLYCMFVRCVILSTWFERQQEALESPMLSVGGTIFSRKAPPGSHVLVQTSTQELFFSTAQPPQIFVKTVPSEVSGVATLPLKRPSGCFLFWDALSTTNQMPFTSMMWKHCQHLKGRLWQIKLELSALLH